MQSDKKFFIQFSHFLAGNGSTLLIGLITFPILTRLFSVAEYGILGLVTTTMLVVVAFAKAGLSDAIIRFFPIYNKNEEKRITFLSTVIVRGFLFSTITAILFYFLFPVISPYIKIRPEFLSCFLIMTVYIFIRPQNIIILNLLRINEKTIFYNILALFGRILSFCVPLLLFMYILRRFYGFFIGLVISEFIVSIILFFWFFRNFSIEISKTSNSLLTELIMFGFPLLLTELSYLLLSYADRYMILYFLGEDQLGVYSVGYNLAMYIGNMFTFSLNSTVTPLYVSVFESNGRYETEEFLKKITYYLLIIIIPVCFGYMAVSKEIINVLASTKYINAATFSPIILFGTVLLGINTVLNAGLYIEKKSALIFIIMISGLISNVILNFLLLPKYGIKGAAISSLLSCILIIISTGWLSSKYISVRFDFINITYHLLLSFIMLLILNQIKLNTIYLTLICKIFIGIMIVLIGILFKERDIFRNILFLLKKE